VRRGGRESVRPGKGGEAERREKKKRLIGTEKGKRKTFNHLMSETSMPNRRSTEEGGGEKKKGRAGNHEIEDRKEERKEPTGTEKKKRKEEG